MKGKIFFVTLLFTIFLFSSCSDDDDNLVHEDGFKKSYKVWLEFKKESANSYTYIAEGSSWVGIAWQTDITVTNGKVVKRHFKYTATEGNMNIPESEMEWTEEGDEIGTHKNTAAADALTMDEVYEKAKNDWLKKRNDVEAFFETENNGMISLCGYVPDGCQDDCFTGIHISKIINTKFGYGSGY